MQLFLTPSKKSDKSRLKKKARNGATSWAENCFVSRVNNSSLYWLEKDRAKKAAKNNYDSLQRVDKIKCGYCKVLVLISSIQWRIIVSVYHICYCYHTVSKLHQICLSISLWYLALTVKIMYPRPIPSLASSTLPTMHHPPLLHSVTVQVNRLTSQLNLSDNPLNPSVHLCCSFGFISVPHEVAGQTQWFWWLPFSKMLNRLT